MDKHRNGLYRATFFMEIVYGLFILTASIKAARVIPDGFILGLTGTLHLLTRVLSNRFAGKLSDRIGRKRPLIAACFIFSISYLILALDGPGFIFLAYFVCGIGNAIFWPTLEAWIGHESHDHNLIRSLGIFSILVPGGIAAGNFIGSLLTGQEPLFIIGGGSLLCMVVIWLVRNVPDCRGGEEPAEPPGMTATNATDPQTAGFIYLGWLANFGSWITIGVMRFLFPKICLELHIPEVWIGRVNIALYLGWIAMTLGMMYRREWMYRFRPLILMQGLGILALLLMAFRPELTVFLIGFGIFGLSVGMTYLASGFYGQDGAFDKGDKSASHEIMLGSGMLIGPFVGGYVAREISLEAPFIMAAICIVLIIGIEFFIWQRFRKINIINQSTG
jgi:MFS family permease